MNSELIRCASEVNLVEWLRQNNVHLIRAGQWWYIKGHDSFRIQGNKWFRNSQGIGGKSIDFLVAYYGVTLKDAVDMLLTGNHSSCNDLSVKEKNLSANPGFSAGSLIRSADAKRVIAYLVKTRGFPYPIVSAELRKGMLFQEAQTANAIFAMTDQTGNITGAEVIGTLAHIRFKGIKAGSSSGYGYSYGQKKNPRYLLFFESGVDLLSFVAISQTLNKSLAACLLVSMAGLRQGTVKNLLRIYPNVTPVLCVDNDIAGRNFICRICSAYPKTIIRQPDPPFKDWNDQLRTFAFPSNP